MFQPQQYFDKAFSDLESARISRQAYIETIDRIYNSLPLSQRKCLDRRRDTRTAGRFAMEIYDNSIRERFLVDRWAETVSIQIVDYGIANNGRLILSPGSRSHTADYLVRTADGEAPLEIKFSPCQAFVTYKVADLEHYIDQGNVLVLTILGDRRMIGPNGDPACERPLTIPSNLKWFTMDATAMRNFLAIADRDYHKGFGGKPTARLQAAQFRRVFQLRDWRAARRVAVVA
jgi:hypothetical protein